MWLTGPAAPWHVGSSQTRARTRVPCISRQILNHCATREAPKAFKFEKKLAPFRIWNFVDTFFSKNLCKFQTYSGVERIFQWCLVTSQILPLIFSDTGFIHPPPIHLSVYPVSFLFEVADISTLHP